MTQAAWSTLLQWSRLGVNAALFLIVARYLTLAEIGAFATAFAPIRLIQVVFKSGIGDAYLISDKGLSTRSAFLVLSALLGLTFTVTFALATLLVPAQITPLLTGLCIIPLLQGLATVPEATLRATLRLKALALRTVLAQILAMILALLALNAGWGAGTLVVFALTNSFVSSLLSIAMAPMLPTAVPTRTTIRLVLPDIVRISVRDLVGNATQPLLQLAVATMLGLPAAGAFQIATRLLGLLDAMAISPIRYIALPRFAALAGTPAFPRAVIQSLRLTSLIAALIYFGALATASDLLSLAVGPAHSATTAPLLPAFCLLGLAGALAMSFNQSLTAIGATQLPLYRALATLVLTALLAIPALAHSTFATAATLPMAAGLVLVGYAYVALPRLGIDRLTALLAVSPALLAGTLMAIALITADPSLQGLNTLVRLSLKIALGAGFYAALLLAFNHLSLRPATS